MNATIRRAFLSLAVSALALGPTCALRAQTWTLDRAIAPQVLNETSVLSGATFVPTPAGQFLVHGDFTHLNEVAVPGLARMEADGRIDRAFLAEIAATERVVRAVPLRDGRVLVLLAAATAVQVAETATPAAVPGGVVNSVTPLPAGTDVTSGVNAVAVDSRGQLFRLRADGRRDTAYNPLWMHGSPQLTLLNDGGVLVWGDFPSVNGAARQSLARLHADGTLDMAFRPSLSAGNLSVTAVSPASDGGVFLSAWSREANSGRTTGYVLTRLRADGTIDPRFDAGTVRTTYSRIAAQPDGGLVVVSNQSILVAPQPGGEDPAVIAPPGGVVVAPFTTALLRFTPTGAVDRAYAAAIPALRSVTALLPLPEGRLVVAANVGAPAGVGSPAVFTLTRQGQVERDFRRLPGAGEGHRLLAVLADGRVLLLQGPLVLASSYYAVPVETGAPALTTTIMPVFLGATLHEPALAISFSDTSAIAPLETRLVRRDKGTVQQLEVDAAGRVVAAGSFTQIDGEPRPGLARFTAAGALDPSWQPPGGELLFVPPDGRAIMRRTVLGPRESDGFHRLTSQIVRLREGGGIDTAFAFPATLDATRAAWLAAAADGRLLVAAFDPDDRAEQNLKLVWLGPDGRRFSTLPTVFTEFTRLVAIPVDVTGAPVAADVVLPYPIFYGRPNVIDAVQLFADGRLLVAGAFARVNGAARPGLVRLLADGKEDAGYVPAVETRRYSGATIPLPDGRAIVLGSEVTGGRWHNHVRRVLASGAIDPGFQPPEETIGTDARLLADGSFFSGGRRFLENGWPDLNFAAVWPSGPGRGYAATAVLTPDGRLWIGGSFEAGGRSRSALVRLAPGEVAGIAAGPHHQTVVAGRTASFQVAPGNSQPAIWRWTRDGATLPGETRATLVLAAVRPEQAGAYRAVVIQGGREWPSEAATLTVTPNLSRIVNFSARGRVVAGSAPQIAGFYAGAATPRNVLLRAVGYGLPAGAMPGIAPLPVPVLTLYEGANRVAEDRGGALAPAVAALARSVGAFPLATPRVPEGAVYGSAIVAPAGTGSFTATTTSGDPASGVALFEFYDSGRESGPPLVRNFSQRGLTGPGAAVLTVGFVIGGNGPLRLLLRGLGPALGAFGIGDAVADPRLALFIGGFSSPLAANDDWGGGAALADAARRAGAFPLPATARDAVIVETLEPGIYSAQLNAAGDATGTGMIEIYVLDP